MGKPLVLALSLAAMVISLSACQKEPEKKIADSLTEMTSDKEVQRMNEIQKQGDESVKRLLGPKASEKK